MRLKNAKKEKQTTNMKDAFTVVVVTKPRNEFEKVEFLKYRNVTDLPKLFKYLTRQNKTPEYANVYDKHTQAFLRREYP